MTDKDDRKTDDGSAGPRPQGGKHGDSNEVELHKRASFFEGVHAKVVEAPKQEKPKGSTGAQTK